MIEIQRINENTPMAAPLASETSEGDEIARKILQDVSSLVDDAETTQNTSAQTEASTSVNEAIAGGNSSESKANGVAVKKSSTFIYALPGEVLKTSLNRHQRGIMDSRIYQLLTKKEIHLPQVRSLFTPHLSCCIPIIMMNSSVDFGR